MAKNEEPLDEKLPPAALLQRNPSDGAMGAISGLLLLVSAAGEAPQDGIKTEPDPSKAGRGGEE